MYFNKDDKSIFFMILTILVVSIISIIAVFSGIWQIIGPSVNKISTDISKALRVNSLDYNFAVPANAQPNPTPQPVPQPQPSPTPSPNPQPAPAPDPTPQPSSFRGSGGGIVNAKVPQVDIQKLSLNYNFAVAAKPFVPEELIDLGFPDAIVEDALLASKGAIDQKPIGDLRIKIPRMKVNSPVLQGRDSTALLKQGFWVYPNSSELGKGEVVLLCHRRYFGRTDPRTCWYIDRMQQDDEIFMYFNGTELKYRVVGINIFDAEDPLIYAKSTDDDYIKISACTPLFSNKQRLVVLAKRVKE